MEKARPAGMASQRVCANSFELVVDGRPDGIGVHIGDFRHKIIR